ncbi:dynamin family protein [Actinotalea solisilvae]|uniref:dynamin family protein n=1 Tax=Actinotalea solisilvae TaxID=2072922 RepID=UPI0018F1BFF6|nr:dynamin family protein [Actinotalea solisilvae]
MAPSTGGVLTGPRGTGSFRAASTPDRPRASSSTLDAVEDLRRDVAATSFPLPLPGVDEAEARRVALLDQLDDHLLPRLRELSAPAVVVVAGSTGAGKSTIVNSVVGSEVSPAGVLRPTTRRPVLVHHPADADLLADHPLRDVVDVVGSDAVPRGIALVDAPDLDSLVASNRATAHRLLEAADLWLFVTTAARYGDALPWQVLDDAAGRGTSVAMVLNRVPADALVTVRTELMARLRDRGMGAVPLFLVRDLGPHEGPLPPAAVAPMRRWLATVSGPDRARAVIARTQRGALAALRPWVDELAEAVQAQVDAADALGRLVRATVSRTADAAADAAAQGAVVAGPVRSRWSAAEARGLLARRVPRRRRADRDAELAALADDVLASLEVVLAQARTAGRAAVRGAVAASDLPGAQGLVDALDALGHDAASGVIGVVPHADADVVDTGTASPHDAALAWAARADGSPQADEARDALARRLGPAAAGVLLAGAAGLEPAAARCADAGRGAAGALVAALREELTEAVRQQVVAGAAPASALLGSADLASDAASRLRLRGAVLKAVR